MKVGTTVAKSPALALTWHRLTNTKLVNRHAAVANLAGETYVLKFRGTSVAWRTITSRTQGKARVFIDGALKATFDNYSATARYGVARRLSKSAYRGHKMARPGSGTPPTGGPAAARAID